MYNTTKYVHPLAISALYEVYHIEIQDEEFLKILNDVFYVSDVNINEGYDVTGDLLKIINTKTQNCFISCINDILIHPIFSSNGICDELLSDIEQQHQIK